MSGTSHIMLTSSNSSSSSVSSESHQNQHTSSRRSPMPPRFYSSPVDEKIGSTPPQFYGLEPREPSICGDTPNLLRRFSYALGGIREDISLDTQKLKRRSTVFFEPSALPAAPSTFDGSRSRPMSVMSSDNSSGQTEGIGRRISRRLSVFSSRSKISPRANISSPNLIGSSTSYAQRSQNSFV